MIYDPSLHRRRSIRLKGYDYSQAGAYYITVCVEDRSCLFGDILDGNMRLSAVGDMIASEWLALQSRFPNVELDEYIVMPNHMHGIIVINSDYVGAGIAHAKDWATTRVAPTLGDMLGAFKSSVTVNYIRGVKQLGWPRFRGRLLQRNFYEHIIRDERDLNRIREYIAKNPALWDEDEENPARVNR